MSSHSEPTRQRRRRSTQPPMEIIQHRMAQYMGQVILNMINVDLQERCTEILQINDVTQAAPKILELLQRNDREQEEKQKNKSRRAYQRRQ